LYEDIAIWFDRGQHVSAAIYLPFAFYPMIKTYFWNKDLYGVGVLFILGLGSLCGGLYELWGFGLRWGLGLTISEKLGEYYLDTISDIAMNLLGAVVGSLLILSLYYVQKTYHLRR
jgi:hypothetical protein